MGYRDDLTALSARHAALEAEVAQKTRELEAASQLLAEAKARVSLPVLDNIRVAAPCAADWSKMTGDERVRHCADCDQDVFNLSDMTREEAEALILGRAGRLCVRYFERADGTILLKNCGVGVKRRRRRRVVMLGAAAMLAGGAVVAYEELHETAQPDEYKVTIGQPPASVMGRYVGAPLKSDNDFK